MSKLNSVKKIAVAAALASTMAVQAFGITASATDYYYYNGVYYNSISDANYFGGANGGYTTYSNPDLTYKYYNDYTRGYYSSYDAARNASSSGSVTYNYNSSNYNYGRSETASGTYLYHNSVTGLYYTNEASAKAANATGTVTSWNASPKAWFCASNGTYYNSYNEAYGAASNDTSKVVRVSNYADTSTTVNNNSYSSAKYYYSSKTGDYYLNWYDARNASDNDGQVTERTTTSYNLYFCRENGLFYSTKNQALSYANNDESKVEYYGYANGSNGRYYNDYYYGYNGRYDYYNNGYYYYNNGYYNNGYYNNGYYNNGYYDPADYYFNYIKNGSTSSSATYGNAENGDAYLSGSKKKAGWSYIKSYINNASSKDSISVYLNEQSTVPSDVLEELEGTRKTLVLTNPNGIKYSIYGADIDDAYSTDLSFTSGKKNIPSSLTKKVSKGASYMTQFTIGREGTLGFDTTATIKFNKKRAGYKATFYRYDTANNRLVSVGTTTIGSDGSASFTTSDGGYYVAILK